MRLHPPSRHRHTPGEGEKRAPGLTSAGKTGFTLIEMAISVAILGLITAGVSAALRSYQETSAVNQTLANMARIQGALTFHAIRTGGDLPVPGGAGTGNCRVGTVPNTDLGLPANEVRDGWGRDIVYVVDEDFTTLSLLDTGTPLSDISTDDLRSSLQFGPDSGATAWCDVAETDPDTVPNTLLCPAYVLISPGSGDAPLPADLAEDCDYATIFTLYPNAIFRTMTAAQIIRDAQ